MAARVSVAVNSSTSPSSSDQAPVSDDHDMAYSVSSMSRPVTARTPSAWARARLQDHGGVGGSGDTVGSADLAEEVIRCHFADVVNDDDGDGVPVGQALDGADGGVVGFVG